MMNSDDIIGQTLGIIKKPEKNLTKETPRVISPMSSDEDDIENDYKYQRENFYGLVERGQDAIDGIL